MFGSYRRLTNTDAHDVSLVDANGDHVPLVVDANSYLKVNVAAGGASGGTSSTFGAAVPATGTAAGFKDGSGNMQLGVVDASGFVKVNVAAGGAGGGASTVADGADVAEGATADAAVTGDNTGTLSAKLRGLNKLFADVWDSVNHWLKVSVQNTVTVTLAGSGVLTLQAAQVSGVANATTTRTTTTGLDVYSDLDILINITNAGAVTGTLQLFLQDSADGGTTWDDLVSSNTFTFGAALTTQRFRISGRLATSGTQGGAAQQEALAAGNVRYGPWGERIRVREKVSGVSGSPTGVTYTITAVAKR